MACASLSAFAQQPLTTKGGKVDAAIVKLSQGGAMMQRQGRKPACVVTADNLVNVMINATATEALAAELADAGYEAHVITDAVLTARVPAKVAVALGQRDEVLYVKAPTQGDALMDKARPAMGVDRLHAGEGLETPFTGKGVVVGVIDQGFEFQHIALLDENGLPSRVRAVWELNKAGSQPQTTIPSGGDNWGGPGHGMHVTGIAVGGDAGNGYYGVAPDAEVVMMPSSFEDSEVLSGIKYVKELAESEGKPWVINMSFGSEMGPHDGTTLYDQTADKLTGDGGILVAAMGNSGTEKNHACYEFENDTTAYFFVAPGSEQDGQFFMFTLWMQKPDGLERVGIKPFAYNPATRRMKYLSAYEMQSMSIDYDGGVDPYNKKQFMQATGSFAAIRQLLGAASTANCYFGVEVTGETGDVAHAWYKDGYGTFMTPSRYNAATPDNLQQTASPASAKRTVAVAAYTTRRSIPSISLGGEASYPESYTGKVGSTTPFSSRGPSLNGQPCPSVAAPGCMVVSAVSKYDKGVDVNGAEITDVRKIGLKKYYYAGMAGTSMASPAVTGTIALWLQANPKLDYEDVMYIFKETSTRDAAMGVEEWDYNRGYGKIDAYAGLKLALNMKETGIDTPLNTTAPVTLLKGVDAWKILFNNDERFAEIKLYATDGTLAATRSLDAPRCGQEETFSFAGVPAGVYLLNITTAQSSTTRKVVVK